MLVDRIQHLQRGRRVTVEPQPEAGFLHAGEQLQVQCGGLASPPPAARNGLKCLVAPARVRQHARPDERVQRRVGEAAGADSLVELHRFLYPAGV